MQTQNMYKQVYTEENVKCKWLKMKISMCAMSVVVCYLYAYMFQIYSKK